jgi:hypothetical protein
MQPFCRAPEEVKTVIKNIRSNGRITVTSAIQSSLYSRLYSHISIFAILVSQDRTVIYVYVMGILYNCFKATRASASNYRG